MQISSSDENEKYRRSKQKQVAERGPYAPREAQLRAEMSENDAPKAWKW